MNSGKAIWYLMNLRNLIIACFRVVAYCLFHPKEFFRLFFLFFSAFNEFYSELFGCLEDFTRTPFFSAMRADLIFCRSNALNTESIVTRPYETQILASLTCGLKPRAVFEIGTYNGLTTLHFAYNTPENATIYTLDLPPDFEIKDKSGYSYDDLMVLQLSKENFARRAYKGNGMGSKVIELFGDSMKFDFSPYYGRIDMVFIDGNHSYRYVQSDTQNAFKMLSENGVIIWHDFDYIIHRDVFKCLNGLSRKYKIYSIPQTRFAIYGKMF